MKKFHTKKFATITPQKTAPDLKKNRCNHVTATSVYMLEMIKMHNMLSKYNL